MKILIRSLLLLFAAVSFQASGLSDVEVTQDTATQVHLETSQSQAIEAQAPLLESSVFVTDMENAVEASPTSDFLDDFEVA